MKTIDISPTKPDEHVDVPGEVYVLLVAARADPDEHWLDLWRGVPGQSLRRFPLPREWLEGGRGDGQLTPDGEFVVPGTGNLGQNLQFLPSM